MPLEIVKPITVNSGTFTRAGTARYMDSSGILQVAGNDVLRVNNRYKGGTPAFIIDSPLFESAASTNLLLYSEQFDNATWVKTASSISANTQTSPDNTVIADTLTASAVNGSIQQSISKAASALLYTFSVYVKSGTSESIVLNMSDGTFSAEATFNITTGVMSGSSTGTWTNPIPSISRLGNLWYRVSITSTSSTGTSLVPSVRIPTISQTLFLWGAQLEQGRLSSYITTNGSTATRAADVLVGTYTSNVPENDYAEWNAGTTYSTLGTRVILLSTHKIYENVNITGNTNKSPDTSPTYWLEVSATNKWKMFDSVISTNTSNSGSVSFVLKPGTVINSLSLLELSATEVTIKMYTAADGFVYSKTISTLGNIPDPNWYDYFFATAIPKNQAVFNDLPAFGNAEFHITVVGPTASVGLCVAGYKTLVGYAIEYGTSIGIQDYSRRERNDFGEIIFVQRAYSKRVNYKMKIPDRSIDSVQRLFASIRSTPVLWIGSEYYDSTIVYGFYKDFNMTLSNPIASDCILEVEGLI